MTQEAVLARRMHVIRRTMPADLWTPIRLYQALRPQGPSFLFESVEGGAYLARYSFIGLMPRVIYRVDGDRMEEIGTPDGRVHDLRRIHPFHVWREALAAMIPEGDAEPWPRFIGGLAGYLGYEMAAFFDRVPRAPDAGLAFPDAILMQVETLLVFDHVTQTLSLFGLAGPGKEQETEDRLVELQRRLEDAPSPDGVRPRRSDEAAWRAHTDAERFGAMVRAAKEFIAAGEAFQIVLARRWSRPIAVSPFAVYRTLRRLNPSPYLFFLHLPGLGRNGEDLALIGASPEMLVRVEGGEATIRPIAGTRPRGRTAEEDRALEAELRADPKEQAEHVMLVDLGRNDLGRVCAYGSVRVEEFMVVERYSHVMHLVSTVRGRLRSGCDAFDALAAAFPAGTVSGAPKVRAMEIIAELEGEARGPYAGGVGYFDPRGNADWCITIRTVMVQGNTAIVQAGAGIVADSVPEREEEETRNKARAMQLAVDQASEEVVGLENR
ncbi:anthranilate synthase component I family protein [Thermoflexus sp.]|uniref:anthranilate synthase component I family protein n=1 Tax=Thermoflexus sp. TaxID=1969742 RepID=UPI0025E5F74B|nr:anthranilate synthase component I family protein [Thermoflexus sp.]MDW8180996.1 anthranilate synthase component I family protein [Anaerolineae bacterium]MCS6962744.1 anthranilate synthase component I family protein [Thermoflexus sp.]MCS7351538.1 anthranilate synthase component I family protein [Thermoflexus sp.]MCX7691321.1 anthranilate synthase component I family protein [Thermoflexus sp.]MDW8184776.1 anthranilate synthase component I family protein [Anaerolineae bacterium]